MYGGCDTCNHSWGETKCMGCLWDGKSRTNTHWEPKEPFINKPCVSEQACNEDKMKVLEKIKTEIEAHAYPIVHGVNNHELGMTLYGILQIIDKHMAESEEA